MALSVLEELLVHVERVCAEDLQCLDEENVAWIPRLGILQPTLAFREIRRVLYASYTVSMRLERVAWLYCWLLPRRKIRPFSRRPTTLSLRHVCGTYYACLINKFPGPNSPEHTVMFLVLWSGQRFAAAYAGTDDEQLRLTAGIHVALRGESVQLLMGLHADLDVAFSAGRQDVGGTPLFRLGRNLSTVARILGQPDPQQQAVDHSMHTQEQGEDP
ncbi:uncharacterized protein LOC119403340 [Rhipicephalus sanguineus]|uniref:uncharacterized protein LOC119403340 n=1 Tax=Rhipicephalus sanguineus TaxID=34632 RepID=UPI001894E9E4|nr:uncharacterized protein LOC119403340 [Rhipicephalus sanguineus]